MNGTTGKASDVSISAGSNAQKMVSNLNAVTGEKAYDALILEARLRQSLMAVRSLGSRGLQVAAMETFAGAPTFSSRWCKKAFICPTDERADAYLSYLEQLLDRINVGILISSSDAHIELIRRHRARLEQQVHIALAKEPALGIALNKERTLEIAKMLGLHIPRALIIAAVSEIEIAIREIGLPAIVKPVQSWSWNNQRGIGLSCMLVTTLEEAYQAVGALTSYGVMVLIQQFLSGSREAVSFLYANGQFYARFAQWAKRTSPPLGGTSVLRQSIAIPEDIGGQAERLVREIELEGYSEVEFRRDNTGKPYLMEINPRLSASVEIAVRAGVDFPYLMYQWALGDQITKIDNYRIGYWMRYFRGDFETTLDTLKQHGRPGIPSRSRAILDFCASFLVPMRYDYLDWKDPFPAFTSSVNFAHHTLNGISNRLLARNRR